MYKNLLVGYKGGGYDGCWWEWNFFFFDENGEFHDLFSSGYAGIKDEETAIDKVQDIEKAEQNRTGDYEVLINLADAEDVARLRGLFAWDLVKHVLTQLEEFYPYPPINYHLVCSCDTCGKDIHVSDFEDGMFGVDIRSSSGRCSGPFYYGKVVCGDCFSKGECSVCREHASSFSESYWGEDQLDEHGYCEFHRHHRLIDLYMDGGLAKLPETQELIEALDQFQVRARGTYRLPEDVYKLTEETWKNCTENDIDVVKPDENPNQLKFNFGEQK